MKKQEFITNLHFKLSGIPEKDVLERLGFISEMIDDRIEEGYTEEDAIKALGPIDNLAARIISETVSSQKELTPTKRWDGGAAENKNSKALIITLIVLGSPIWISLAAAAFSIVVSAYAVIWSLVGSLWAVFGAFVGAGAGGFFAAIVIIFTGGGAVAGISLSGASLFLLGASVPTFYGCLWTTKGAAWLSKQIAIGIKNIFTRR